MHPVKNLLGIIRRVPRRVIETIFFIAVAAFFLLYLHGLDWQQLKHLQYNWWYLLAATIFMIITRYWFVLIWRVILSDLGATTLPRFNIMAHVYAKAWLGRYIPGTVTWIAGKVYMASAHSISKTRLAVSSLLEGSMQVIAILSVSLLLLGFDSRLKVISLPYKIAMVAFACALLFTLIPAVFNRILRLAYVKLKHAEPSDELLINGTAVIHSFLLYAIGGFIAGIAEFFITRTIIPGMSWHNFFFIVGAFNLAGALGIIAIGVPSGLGVRDGVLLVLLSAIMPKELALAVTVTSRLWSAFSDVAFFAVTAIIRRSGLEPHSN